MTRKYTSKPTRQLIQIAGMTHYLWRAVHQHGDVLDILGTSRRDAQAANRFFPKPLKGWRYVPRVLVTDKLTNDGPAHRRLTPVWSTTAGSI